MMRIVIHIIHFYEYLFQQEACQVQISEVAYMDTLSSKPIIDIEFQESNKIVYDTLQIKLQDSSEDDSLQNGHQDLKLISQENYDNYIQ